MVAPVKVNFKVYQGSTLKELIRWESNSITYKTITGITKAAPMVVTAVGHAIPLGWRAKIVDVIGMKDVNSADNYLVATGTTTDTITFNAVNSSGYTAYTSGGTLYYNTPSSLSGITARMQIRAKLGSTTVLEELTTENGKIILDDTLKTITLLISATQTATYTWTSAVYSLEVISGAIVTPLIYGSITLDKEITR